MRQAVVSVDTALLANQGFRFAVFQDAGVLDIELLSCEGSRGVIRIHVEERLDPHRLDEMDAIQWWEQVSSEGSEYVYLIEADATDTRDTTPSDDDRYPRCERMEVSDEGITLTYAGPQDRISEEFARLERAGDSVSLEKLRSYRAQKTPLDTLTDRQRDVLEVAFNHGYYDVPRSASVQEIAAELDLDDSTVAEHLQRAERNLLKHLLNRSR